MTISLGPRTPPSPSPHSQVGLRRTSFASALFSGRIPEGCFDLASIGQVARNLAYHPSNPCHTYTQLPANLCSQQRRFCPCHPSRDHPTRTIALTWVQTVTILKHENGEDAHCQYASCDLVKGFQEGFKPLCHYVVGGSRAWTDAYVGIGLPVQRTTLRM